MDSNAVIFPEKLYKHRCGGGDAEYIHIEGDVYEDTTCTHYGDKCRIRVKPVDDHFEFVETANKIAKEYITFHLHCDGDTYYFPSRTRVALLMNESAIESYRKNIKYDNDRLAEASGVLAVYRKPEKLNDQSLDALDFGSKVYFFTDDDKKIKSQIVEYRKFGKDGIVEVETPDYFIRRDENNPKRLRAIPIYGEDEEEHSAFVSPADATDYILNEGYEHFSRSVETWKEKIERTEASLANALARKADLEHILEEEQKNA